ncbi:enoyl-CoA hydratase [Gemmobacter megaterium]|uniref:Enoyl-CoA hydratase n=1 Tax=Gemmobacter megaterium TaxID=1086013 RepID=A0A1N7N3Z1_9RHOB|nr:enoyl-CoA hydratase/isomerase family protein [Gemmobacter megaterium]GGE12964.1 putative enoyl-CoA hydratase/isomerase [Gemmobacter megaterium]SIS93123.1 enoyl-CoA hydratase [Gemmobacter megaterium]
MVRYDTQGAVALITLDRPDKLNAMSLAMYDALGAAYIRARDDEAVRAIVLTGAGERAFSVGADLTESIPALAEDRFDISAWDPAHAKGIALYKPVIAAVRGACIGGGMEFMLSTDIRVVAEDALFQLPEPRHGFVPAGGTLVRLVRQAGYAHAMQIMLLAERLTAADLYRMGIVNEVLPADQVLPRAMAMAQGIASLGAIAVQTIKEAALTLHSEPLDLAFAREAVLGQRAFTCDDAKAGLQRFVERGRAKKDTAQPADRRADRNSG